MREELSPRSPDAFSLTADPAAYVPRLALESALEALQAAVLAPTACAALVGGPGLGKTLLLRVLAQRLEGALECVYVPFPRLSPHELWAWLASVLGLGRSDDDCAAVLRHAERAAGDGLGLVLLVDDAGALPADTQRELVSACRAPGFAVVLAFAPEDTGLRALPADVPRVELGPPMTLAETRTYVRARLRRVDPSGVVAARLGAAQIAELHEASGGVPARVHELLDAWLRGRGSETPLGAPGQPAAPSEPSAARATSERSVALDDGGAHADATGRTTMPSPPPLEHRSFFRTRTHRRSPLVVAVMLALLLGALWYYRPEAGRPLLFEEPSGSEAVLDPAVLEREAARLAAEPGAPAEPPASAEDTARGAPAPPDQPGPSDVAAAPTAPEPSVASEEAPAAEPAAGEEPSVETAALAGAPAGDQPETPTAPVPIEPPTPVAETAPVPTPEPPSPAERTPPAPEPPPVAAPPLAAAPASAPPVPAPSAPVARPEPSGPPPGLAAAAPPGGLPLGPARPGPRLSVNAEPWAEIRIDGRSFGETPLGEIPLAPGRHRVSATFPDGRVVERTVEARSGDLFVVFP